MLSMYRTNNTYLIRKDWDLRKMNNRIDLELKHSYEYTEGNGNIIFKLETSSLASNYNYSKLNIEATNTTKFNKLKINTRSFIQLGTGDHWADESKLTLSGANSEEMMDSKFTRSEGFISSNYMDYDYRTNYFHSAGGLNIRGYNGYFAPEFNEDGSLNALNHKGISGASINAEIDFTAYLPYSVRMNSITSYLFTDAGIITNEIITKNNYKDIFSKIRADAGIGFTYTFDKFSPIESVKPFIIRFDIPFFLNRPPASDEDFVEMRWIIGINRAF